MKKQSIVTILSFIILAVLVAFGVLGLNEPRKTFTKTPDIKSENVTEAIRKETKKPSERPKNENNGIIEGSLSYPSSFIPHDMRICAENITTKQQYCTQTHLVNKKYLNGKGYKIEVPPGDYYVFATLPSWKNHKAYYSEFITCGLNAECLSHKPIIVTVKKGGAVTNINPYDWYYE